MIQHTQARQWAQLHSRVAQMQPVGRVEFEFMSPFVLSSLKFVLRQKDFERFQLQADLTAISHQDLTCSSFAH